jgi:UDP-2,4-diacetamido-2,4,6-trideoxy-beta-L-altropyranose hydrolase
VVSLPEETGEERLSRNTTAHGHWLGANWKADAERTISAIGSYRPDWIVVDHYALDHLWEEMLRPHCGRIMVIDDLADRRHDCDLLLDQNLVASYAVRYDSLAPPACTVLLGPTFALLQPEYATWHPRVPPRVGPVRQLLVYFGGADSANLTGLTIEALSKLREENIRVDVVVNPSSSHAAVVKRQAAEYAWIEIHESLPSLADLMVRADLAIGAGGATSWERCCLGLPALVIALADNQVPIATELDRHGMVQLLGNSADVSADSLLSRLKGALSNPAANEMRSRQCLGLVDGLGASRVASLLLLNGNSRLVARLATPADEKQLRDTLRMEFPKNPSESNSENTCAGNFFRILRDHSHHQIYIVTADCDVALGAVVFTRSDAWHIQPALLSHLKGSESEERLIPSATLAFRQNATGVLRFETAVDCPARASSNIKQSTPPQKKLRISICSDKQSWINPCVSRILSELLNQGHSCVWSHNAEELPDSDVCFLLSYGKIVGSDVRSRHGVCLVVHESDLPKGRGWSPASWLILSGNRNVPVTLIEAVNSVDAGDVFGQIWITVSDVDLVDDWRQKISHATARLVTEFVQAVVSGTVCRKPQVGIPTYFNRRGPKDSELNVRSPLIDQFGLVQIVDNSNYPMWFMHRGAKFRLLVYRDKAL